MDKWIRKLKSVEIIESPNDSPTIRYTNSAGDRIETYRDRVSVIVGDQVKTLCLKDIKSVDMNPMFKRPTEDPYVIINTNDETIRFLVDTHTDQFDDLPTVYDYIRRRAVVG